MVRWPLAGLVALLSGGVLWGQARQTAPPPTPEAVVQTPTFRAEIEYVEVDALVTDEDGSFVRGLTKDDFVILEDGKPQTISAFSLVDIPVEREERPLGADAAIEPDVQSNERPFEGRVYVMILDDLHTAALRTQLVQRAARQFIERNLGANDLMAVVQTGGRTDASQEFTSRKRLLLEAVDKFMGRKLPTVTISRSNGFFRQLNGAFREPRASDPDELERGYNAQATMSVLRSVAEWFGGVRGRRKTMLFVSEGIDFDITEIIRQPGAPASVSSAIYQDIRDTINATARSNVSIYAIDPRGLTQLADETIELGSLPEPDRLNRIDTSTLAGDLQRSHDNLRALAEQTGGFAAVNRNDFTTAFERIVRDNSSYYVLAYYPSASRRDGRFHRIQVRVRRPNLDVRARRGYMAPRGAAPAPVPRTSQNNGASLPVLAALNSPLQVSGLLMRAFAAPFKGVAPNASVLLGVELAGRDLSLAENGVVEVSSLAIDSRGTIHNGRTDRITLKLRPESKARIEQSGVRVLSRMELPPGRYQVRVASHDVARGAVGSVLYDLDVPDFGRVPVGMSGLVLTSMAGSVMMVPRQDEELRRVLPAAPIGQRVFPGNDEIALFVEVYDNTGAAPHKVDIVCVVRSEAGTIVFESAEERDSRELQGARGGYGYTARVPLTELSAGRYVLAVEARSRLGNAPAARREVQFRVVPPPAPPGGR